MFERELREEAKPPRRVHHRHHTGRCVQRDWLRRAGRHRDGFAPNDMNFSCTMLIFYELIVVRVSCVFRVGVYQSYIEN